ncbi:putative ribosome-binding factor A, mitochondrial isoform X1 [Sapajus apella]|uniref:Ribosome-binding factor A, mitochondrial isoform X1 n=1 Tax=Sapajus apella TaxID=9515 RepID=A0A6J3J5L1_SAPAP|nr:putative ribosome-binding factor A, mitochondrial isoform X1 [Sapajus apella]
MWAAAGRLWGSRAGLRVLLRSRDAALVPDCARGLHGSAVSCKNWLKKFASKTKKKFWYEGPSLGSHLTYKPSKLEFLMRSTSKKTRKEDHVRLRAVNGLLYKALTDLLCTPEVSQELYDLNVELSKVSLTPDFSACRVYWKTTLSAEQNARTEAVLQKSAAHMRHLLMSQQTLRNVPPIVFVKDKRSAALAEIDQLLAVADFGPPDQTDDFVRIDFRNPDALQPCGTTEPTTSSSLCGIDHEALNRQIMEYKRRKDKGLGGLVWQEQVAELTVQMKKGRKKAKPSLERDSSLESYLLGEEDEDDLDLDGAPEYEYYAPDTEELEAERRGSITEDDHGCRARGE